MHDPAVTIVAVATPVGRGGVGCLRLSGPRAHAIASKLFASTGSAAGDGIGRAVFGRFRGRDEGWIDHGYLVRFAAEAAFSGEPTAELWPHGSPAVLAELIAAAVAQGAEAAGPGEFTYRALRNGRLDLARAEAVRDLVEARTLYQARVAFAQAEGALSRRLRPLRERLAELIVRGEAAVEFVDESETHLPAGALDREVAAMLEECAGLLRGFDRGRIVREGAALVISGAPNVGKSSLFNRLLARDRAIVTDRPGTTRDTLEELLDLSGVPVRLVDTAGLRHVEDPVEGEGVRRAEVARREADVELYVLDGSRLAEPAELEALGSLDRRRTLVVVNKSDLPRRLADAGEDTVLSAETGEGFESLERLLGERLLGSAPLEDPVLTDARHARALSRTAENLERARRAGATGLTEELVLEDLREAMQNLGSITGEFTYDELYDQIFSTFCIGK